MTSNDNKAQKNPTQNEIELILKYFSSNKLDDANKMVNDQISKYPDSFILFNILGAILSEKKELKGAIESYKKSITINPNYAEGYNNLAIAFQKIGKIDLAIDNYKKAINLKSEFSEAFNNLGNAISELKKLKEAIPYFEKAIKINPNFAMAIFNLGKAHQDLGHKEEALDYFQQAIKIKPNYADVYNNMGLVLNDLRRFDEALNSYKKAIKFNPKHEKAYNNLANFLNNQGKYDEATSVFHEVIKIKPDYSKAYSNLLFNLNYKVNFDPNEYLLEAKNYRLNCKTIKKKLSFKYTYEKEPKKLKVGLVSADFGNHPGGFFTLSTLRKLRDKNFELIAYSTADRKDEFSPHFRPLFSKWHSIEKKKDEEIIEKIFNDGIHILMDLQGHSANNRLPIFMYKPAPIQATWLGQGSTGIPEIDYFIGSPHITPENEEKYYVEKIIRLPEISQCFTPPDYDLKVNNLPALKNKFITFGCVNKLSKINDEVISLWSKILLLVKGSKLILKNKDFDDQNTCVNTFKRFEKNNIEKNRIILKGESKTRKELLEIYHKIDIGLDPFPFQGITTTCEAVWMGVPVITLKGNRYLFHFGESINSNLDMQDWISEDYKDYISKAVKFSSDLDYLSQIRMNLREKALKSPVFDAERFSEHFSNMLWNIWKNFVDQKK